MSRDAFIGFIPVQKGQDVSKSSSLVSTSDGLKIDLKRVGCLRAAENFVRRSFYEKVGETAHEQEWAKFQQLLKLEFPTGTGNGTTTWLLVKTVKSSSPKNIIAGENKDTKSFTLCPESTKSLYEPNDVYLKGKTKGGKGKKVNRAKAESKEQRDSTSQTAKQHPAKQESQKASVAKAVGSVTSSKVIENPQAVSYTHLTLPTIYSV